jgi:predicted DNA-binding transcriptional regulator AlpA
MDKTAIAEACADAERAKYEEAARAALSGDYLDAKQLEQLTGTRQSTWRYWASIEKGPPSFKLGRRRVWRKSAVLQWIAEQEAGPP